MIDVRPLASLGHADHGWLNTTHHFSFARYFDPGRMGWGRLRVWNDDTIAPGTGFPPHPHRDMEIITYVREGAITHEDSLGNRGRTSAGDVQVMSAGAGVRHAEWNLENVPTRIFQIWIEPREAGAAPRWGTRPFPKGDRAGRWVTLASGFGEADALPIRADARVLGATLPAGARLSRRLAPGTSAYLVGATGRFRVHGVEAAARDGVAVRDLASLDVEALEDAKLVLVETLEDRASAARRPTPPAA
ncbi:MAG: pirin family protein [Sphingomonadaceae bacterium]|uniref:pirin family protein n=1 Tax=Thermaurantiacus sp. TaxID=2820283 RepID=UPI00298F2BA9|nr:pirin family protein [Thermaurantiacus sp.]MCS6987355.1 pirin family protein [Sphingomonadaceae bacterium]MDW8414576.1 pirin family protein [Thermaurantiacus sp.]